MTELFFFFLLVRNLLWTTNICITEAERAFHTPLDESPIRLMDDDNQAHAHETEALCMSVVKMSLSFHFHLQCRSSKEEAFHFLFGGLGCISKPALQDELFTLDRHLQKNGKLKREIKQLRVSYCGVRGRWATPFLHLDVGSSRIQFSFSLRGSVCWRSGNCDLQHHFLHLHLYLMNLGMLNLWGVLSLLVEGRSEQYFIELQLPCS